ncbi:MAG: FG-GAP repeat domain-containing protein [bacterium]
MAWYENTDSQGSFGEQRVITTSAEGAESVYAADLDGDGDFDVLSASGEDDKIAWYENTDGKGNFGPQKVISISVNWPESVYAADLDGDGDVDVLSASDMDGKITFYENTDSKGHFEQQQVITTSAEWGLFIYVADLDGDGDLDVLTASSGDVEIAWYRNLSRSVRNVRKQ